MSAAAVLRAARAAGVELTIDGNDLLLEAASEPPASVVDALRRHKAEVVAMLRPDRDGWSTEDRQLFFEERAAIAEFDGGLPRTEADAQALACCIVAWLNRNPTRSAPGRCARCGQAESRDAVVLPYGTDPDHIWLHAECWPAVGHASISGEGGSGSNGYRRFIRWPHRNWWLWSSVKQATGLKVLRLIEETMEIDEPPENDERLLKKPEILRDAEGRFEQHGAGLKKAQKKVKSSNLAHQYQRGHNRPGPGRPKGSRNRITTALKDLILRSLDEVGGVEYLKRLAIENSSAYASLLGKVLPATLDTSAESNGGPRKIEFVRVIVMPDGRRHVEGKTPLQIAPPERRYDGGIERPASHTLPNSGDAESDTNDINGL